MNLYTREGREGYERGPGGAILVRRHYDLRRLGGSGAGVLVQDAAEGSVLQILG